MAVRARADKAPDANHVHRVISTAFDPDFYRAAYPDIPDDAGVIQHYLAFGWREGRDPAPWFSVEAYLREHPDVRRRGLEPLSHFLTRGRREGREVRPSRHALDYFTPVAWAPKAWSHRGFALGEAARERRRSREIGTVDPAARAAVAEAFDTAHYRALNPDVAAAGVDPLDHFLESGWREGRDPTAWFSVRGYLEANPDVAAAGLNPFVHYIVTGRDEGRSPSHDLGFRYDLIAGLRPIDEQIADALARSAATPIDPFESLADALAGAGDLRIVFAPYGGTESPALAGRLELSPAVPWPVVRLPGEPGPLKVSLDGRKVGVFPSEAVREALGRRASAGGQDAFVIESLVGHDVDEVAAILEAAGLSEGAYRLTDYSSLCAGARLLRDEVADCAAPPPESAACSVCVYGPGRARHRDAHRRLFERLALTVTAPGEAALDFWRERAGLPARAAIVAPPIRLAPRGPAPRTPARRRFRVVFAGDRTPASGWPVWQEVAARFAEDRRYEFHDAGSAVAALEPDAAIVWPLWRELFSAAARQAVAAGAAILTGADCGDAAAFAASGHGRVFVDEAVLMAAFESGDVLALARNRRGAMLYDLVPGETAA